MAASSPAIHRLQERYGRIGFTAAQIAAEILRARQQQRDVTRLREQVTALGARLMAFKS